MKTSSMKIGRSIRVTLEEATRWYISDNDILRSLALSAYTKKELTNNISYFRSKVCTSNKYINIPIDNNEKYSVLADLDIIAEYLNGNWKKAKTNTGYFLTVEPKSKKIVISYSIYYHVGVTYFKDSESATKALEIIGERIKCLLD